MGSEEIEGIFEKIPVHLTHVWRPFCQPNIENFSYNPLQQLSELKNDIFSKTFSKNVLIPLPHVFEAKTVMLSQKVSHSYTASFFGQI